MNFRKLVSVAYTHAHPKNTRSTPIYTTSQWKKVITKCITHHKHLLKLQISQLLWEDRVTYPADEVNVVCLILEGISPNIIVTIDSKFNCQVFATCTQSSFGSTLFSKKTALEKTKYHWLAKANDEGIHKSTSLHTLILEVVILPLFNWINQYLSSAIWLCFYSDNEEGASAKLRSNSTYYLERYQLQSLEMRSHEQFDDDLIGITPVFSHDLFLCDQELDVEPDNWPLSLIEAHDNWYDARNRDTKVNNSVKSCNSEVLGKWVDC